MLGFATFFLITPFSVGNLLGNRWIPTAGGPDLQVPLLNYTALERGTFEPLRISSRVGSDPEGVPVHSPFAR